MPLSEGEERVLAEMERALSATDRSSVRSDPLRSRTGSAIASTGGCALGVLVGVGCVLLGVASAGVAGVIGAVSGFTIIVVSCACVIGVYHSRSSALRRGSRA